MIRRALVVVLGLTFWSVGLAGPASADGGSKQRFIVYASESDGEGFAEVVAIGPITGVGTFEETEDENIVVFHFEEGSITLFVPSDEESEEFDEESCIGSFSFSGPWEIISGTGAYEDASGSGWFEGQGHFFGVREDGGCSEEEGTFFFIVEAFGHVDLGEWAAA